MTTPSRDPLPLERSPVFTDGTWSIQLPVRAERITVSTQTRVYERVRVAHRRIEDVARVEAVLRHEELRTATSGRAQIDEEVTDKIPQP